MAMSKVTCTRIPEDPFNPVNPLMVPFCHCPRCAAEPDVVTEADAATFLRLFGQQQRFRVEKVDLGPAGHSALG